MLLSRKYSPERAYFEVQEEFKGKEDYHARMRNVEAAQYRVLMWSFASYAHNMQSANPGYYKRLLEAPIYPNPSFYQIQLDIPRYQFPQNTKAEQLDLHNY